MISRMLPTVCVIGAGSSGIAAAKTLHERGFEFDCFETGDRVGGNWVYKNANGMSVGVPLAAHQHLARADGVPRLPDAASVSRLPAPHPHRRATSTSYVDHFGFRDRITFDTGVERAEPRDRAGGSRWTRGRTRTYDALMVANGHHWDARWPEPAFPGSDVFAGVQMHSHDYLGDDPAFFRDKHVVVLGMGNSAMDIAVEASFTARGDPPGRPPRRVGDPQVPVRRARWTSTPRRRRSRSRSAGG